MDPRKPLDIRAQLDRLDPAKLPIVRSRANAQRRLTIPSNQEILDAVKASYDAHQGAIDQSTLSGQSLAQSSDGQAKIATLNQFDWQSRVVDPSVATPVLTDNQMEPAMGAARSDSGLITMSIGIAESAQLILGEEGGIGVAFALDGSSVKGVGYVAGKLGLDIDVGINLSVGLWGGAPADLAGPFFALELNLDLEISVSLAVYLNQDLSFTGATIGVGVGLGGGATIVAGETFVF